MFILFIRGKVIRDAGSQGPRIIEWNDVDDDARRHFECGWVNKFGNTSQVSSRFKWNWKWHIEKANQLIRLDIYRQ